MSTDHSKTASLEGLEWEMENCPLRDPDLPGPRAHQLSLSRLSQRRLAQFSRE